MGDGAGEVVILFQIRAQEEHGHRAEDITWEEHGLHPHRMAVDGDGEADAGVLEEGVFHSAELNGEIKVITAGLIVVAVSPENADAAEVLPQIRCRAHVGACQEAETPGVDLEALVDGELTGKVDSALSILWVDLIVVGEGRGKKRRSHGVSDRGCGGNEGGKWAVRGLLSSTASLQRSICAKFAHLG